MADLPRGLPGPALEELRRRLDDAFDPESPKSDASLEDPDEARRRGVGKDLASKWETLQEASQCFNDRGISATPRPEDLLPYRLAHFGPRCRIVRPSRHRCWTRSRGVI